MSRVEGARTAVLWGTIRQPGNLLTQLSTGPSFENDITVSCRGWGANLRVTEIDGTICVVEGAVTEI